MARHLGAALQWVRAAIPVRPAACATVTQCPTARRPRRAAVPASRSGKLIQAGVVAVSLTGGFGHAADHCSRDWACIEVQESEQGVALFARNMKPYPIAMTVAVSASNMVGGSREPITLELPGMSRRPLAQLRGLAEGMPWDYRYNYDWTVGSLQPDHDDDYLYRLPYASDASFPILQGYGSKFSHRGLEYFTVDFRMPEGTPVHAARDGVVAMIEESHNKGCWGAGCGQHANYVVILHADGTTGEYYHLQQNGALVVPGERVERGQLIARSGNTGNTTVPHLHFGVYRAVEWGRTQSIAVRFKTRDGMTSRPRVGTRYLNP